jgi:hypothetical protein
MPVILRRRQGIANRTGATDQKAGRWKPQNRRSGRTRAVDTVVGNDGDARFFRHDDRRPHAVDQVTDFQFGCGLAASVTPVAVPADPITAATSTVAIITESPKASCPKT